MDEVRMIRDRYPEPAPPTAQEISRAKALLTDPPRRSMPRLWLGLGGVVAAGTAAVVALSLAGGNTPAPPLRTVNLSDRGAILAAAVNAERQPIGKYWYTDEVDGQSYIVRAKTGTYAITGALGETYALWGAKAGMGKWSYERDLPARPQTAQDVALWRRAGSPSSFRVWSSDHYATYSTKATRWKADTLEPRGGGDFLDGYSVKELQNLPADPVKLTQLFLSPKELSRAAGLPAGKTLKRIDPGAKVVRVATLLESAPIPPKARAGLMRALVAQPGVSAIGRVTDPLGRTGVAVASADRATTVTGEFGVPEAEQGTYRSREVLVFDERTGALLSDQNELTQPGGPYGAMKPGFVINYWTTRSAAWTDTKPAPSAGLPFG